MFTNCKNGEIMKNSSLNGNGMENGNGNVKTNGWSDKQHHIQKDKSMENDYR